MTVSVVLCTYNGELYLEELLTSLKDQTYEIDELIIADDGSTDKTKHIISSFRKSNNNVKVIYNQKGKGAARNFIETAITAKGDLVFFCDQDDIWMLDKIEKMTAVMENRPEINMLASSLKPMFQGKTSLKSYLAVEKQGNNEKVMCVKPMAKNFNIKRSGCTMCIRKQYLQEISDLWVEGWYHDDFVWKCAVVSGCAAIYNYHTVVRRIHERNSSIHIERTRNARIKLIEEEMCYINIAGTLLDNEHLKTEINKFIHFQNRRKQIIKNRNILLLVYNIVFCGELYRTKGQMLMDLYFVICKTK